MSGNSGNDDTYMKEPLRPPLPPVPKCESKHRYMSREMVRDPKHGGTYLMYSFENLNMEAAPSSNTSVPKDSAYSSSEGVLDMLQNLHSEVENLKEKIHGNTSTKSNSLYENIDKRRTRGTRAERMLISAREAGLFKFRFILDPHISGCKRFAWILLLTCALGLLVFQVLDRVLLYISCPTSVTMETHYFETLLFPAVTVCNRNLFRLTKLVDMGLFDAVHALYNADHGSDGLAFSTKVLEFDEINGNFIRNISHQKHEFIRSCMWKGMSCGPENFSETLTDYGLCYTFNPHTVHSLVHGNGPADGLFLELNVEQYEYLLGARSAVGARFAVHDRGHVPRMGERGIDVAVGTHTAMEFDMIKNWRISSSTSRCLESHREIAGHQYNREACLADCEARQVQKLCGCFHTTKAGLDKRTVVACGEVQYVRCLLQGKEMPFAPNTDCICQPSCETIEYNTMVSHAAMSAYAADSTVRRMKDRLALESTLQNARDTYHRLDDAIYTYDMKTLSHAADALKNVTVGINSYIVTFRENDEKYELFLDEIHEALKELNTTVAGQYPKFYLYTHMAFFVIFRRITRLLESILTYEDVLQSATDMYVDDGKKTLRDIFGNILQEIDKIIGSDVKTDGSASSIPLLTELENGLLHFRTHIVFGYAQKYREFEGVQQQYNQTTNTMLNMTDYIKRVLHQKQMLARNISMYHYFSTQRMANTLRGLLKDIRRLQEFECKQMVEYIDKLVDSYHSHVSRNVSEFVKNVTRITKEFPPAMKTIQNSMANLEPVLTTLHRHAKTLSRKFTSLGDKYSDGKMSKTALASSVNSEELQIAMKRLKASLNNTQNLVSDILESSSFMARSLKPIIYRFTDFGIKQRREMVTYLESLKFPHLRDTMFRLIRTTEQTLHWVTEYRLELFDYLRGNRVNGRFYLQNFLQVELYFKDLKETSVSQKSAYNLFDFACDIGGSFALYLGLSALTIFEIIDFAITGLFCNSRRRQEAKL